MGQVPLRQPAYQSVSSLYIGSHPSPRLPDSYSHVYLIVCSSGGRPLLIYPSHLEAVAFSL